MLCVLRRTLSLADIGVYLLISAGGLAFSFGSVADTWIHAELGLGFLRVMAVFFTLSSVAVVLSCVVFARQFHYGTLHGLTVGWTSSKYEVRLEEIERMTRALIKKAEVAYGDCVHESLRDSLVLFREPTWLQDSSLPHTRAIAGEQDGKLLQVGWTSDLKKGAFVHELAHLILDLCHKPRPTEAEAHRLMRDKEWC